MERFPRAHTNVKLDLSTEHMTSIIFCGKCGTMIAPEEKRYAVDAEAITTTGEDGYRGYFLCRSCADLLAEFLKEDDKKKERWAKLTAAVAYSMNGQPDAETSQPDCCDECHVDHHHDGFHSEDPMVEHPSHYTNGTLECIEWIEAELSREEYTGYLKGNIFKYLWRYPDKNGVQDVEKALWYLNELRDSLRAWKLLDEQEETEEERVHEDAERVVLELDRNQFDRLSRWCTDQVQGTGTSWYSIKFFNDTIMGFGSELRISGLNAVDPSLLWRFEDLNKARLHPTVEWDELDGLSYILDLPYPKTPDEIMERG